MVFLTKEGVDYFNTYPIVASTMKTRVLFALAYLHDLIVHQMNVKITLLNGDLNEEIYKEKPEGYVLLDSPIKGETHNLGGDNIFPSSKGKDYEEYILYLV